LYYYRARFYNPTFQRFISEDPILHAGNPSVPYLVPALLIDPITLHPYGYVGNNSPNWTDPHGLYTWVERMFVAGVGLWKLFGPVPVFIEGLGWIKPTGIIPPDIFHPKDLGSPEELDDDRDGIPNFMDPDSPYCKVNCKPPSTKSTS
jgi:RHS repeat-associated protein